MNKYLRAFLPTPAVTLMLLFLPVILTTYFVVTQYADRFILENNVTYFDVQNNWFGQALIGQEYLEWFNRFMDFAFWGVLALVVLIGVWAVSSTKVAFKNHYARTEFVNFKENKHRWHGSFFMVLASKIVLVVLALYALFAVVGKHIPQLSAGISGVLADKGLTLRNLGSPVLAFLAIFMYQYLFVSAIRTFKHLRAE